MKLVFVVYMGTPSFFQIESRLCQMKRFFIIILSALSLSLAFRAQAQTRLKLSSITPGSEQTRLVYNGDFEFQTLGAGGRILPTGWSSQGDMILAVGVNTNAVNRGWVASGRVDNSAPVSQCQRMIVLEPATQYVLSAYMWNMGDATNHVATVVDLNDAFGEPQMILSAADSEADHGYFVYRSFNTATTGTNVVLRCFYDGFSGTGAAPAYFPVGAQWDNISITRASEFAPPAAANSGANILPSVRITAPTDGTNLFIQNWPAVAQISAEASDLDGSIIKVEFFADAVKVGQGASLPWTVPWTNSASGDHSLWAVATDNKGATTQSAPVSVAITVPPPPISLSIATAGTNVEVSWPVGAPALFLKSTTNLALTNAWKLVTNVPSSNNTELQVTVPGSDNQRFFQLAPDIDPSTLDRKMMMGYQGWFACANDGSPVNRWVHWFRRQSTVATNATVDFWPDISELDSDELYPTEMTLPGGAPAQLYSAFNRKTVVRHFKWMKDYQIDGVFLQRFTSELGSPSFFALRNRVAENVRAGAEENGRVFAIMYDISGQSASTLLSALTNDWAYLTGTLRLTNSPCYVRHNGKPVVAVWGLGFTDRPGTPQDAQAVIAFFKAANVTLMGGVPTGWRTLNSDSQTASAWASVYRSFDIISPWAVGRYGTTAEADNFKLNQIVPDLNETRLRGIDYMPVVFPGFSWHNLNAGTLNQIPRYSGTFYWRQVYNALTAGCSMIYVAMFDEMDEGTAMLKMAPTRNELPAQGQFVPLNVDGKLLPSDWYLRVAGEASKMLRREIPLTSQIQIKP